MMNTGGMKSGHSDGGGGGTEIKLFGVQIAINSDDSGGGGDAESSFIRRTKSLGNLDSCIPEIVAAAVEPSGYLSDGSVHPSSKSNDRKRGKPWSEDEHRSFLAGLEKLGKGDWKGISNYFVPSRSSTQVASHAQKYFNRLSSMEKRRRRTSVFDIPLTVENQQSNKASSSVASSSNVFERRKQTNKTAQVVTTSSVRPPLIPMNIRRVIPEYSPSPSTMVYQPRTSSLTDGYPTQTQTVIPTVSWVPVVNFPSHRGVFLPSTHGFVLQGSSSREATGSAVQTANNDELNRDIKKLTL